MLAFLRALQGGVPLPVYNTVHMMMPMNLQRIRSAAARLKPAEVQDIEQRQAAMEAASKAAAGLDIADTAADKLQCMSLGVRSHGRQMQQQPQAVQA